MSAPGFYAKNERRRAALDLTTVSEVAHSPSPLPRVTPFPILMAVGRRRLEAMRRVPHFAVTEWSPSNNLTKVSADVRNAIQGVVLGFPQPFRKSLDTIRREFPGCPIVAVVDSRKSCVAALEAGADDAVFPRTPAPELIARIKSGVRVRGAVSAGLNVERPVPQSGPLSQMLMRRAESALLSYFAQNPEQILSQAKIIADVFGGAHAPDTSLVRVHVLHLRRILRDSGEGSIHTVRGRGYIFKPPVVQRRHSTQAPARRVDDWRSRL